jgi:hypothetical protein
MSVNFNSHILKGFEKGVSKSNYKDFINLALESNEITMAFFYLYRKSKGSSFSVYEVKIINVLLKNIAFKNTIEGYIKKDQNAKINKIKIIDEEKRANVLIDLLNQLHIAEKIKK